jgi:ribosomal protein S18 acetylase RimI-like enzyme
MYGITDQQCNLMDVFVSSKHRGQGLGTALFNALEEKLAKETWVHEIKLGVRSNNNAIELYKRLGFKPYVISMFKTIKR